MFYSWILYLHRYGMFEKTCGGKANYYYRALMFFLWLFFLVLFLQCGCCPFVPECFLSIGGDLSLQTFSKMSLGSCFGLYGFFLMLDLLCFTIVWHIWLLQTHHMLDYPVFHYPSLHWWKKHAIVMTGYILIVYGVNVYSQHFTGQQHLDTQMLFQWKMRMSTHQSVEYCWHLQDRINLVFFNGCSWRKHVGVLSCEISVEYWYFHHIWVSVLSLMY